MHVKHLGRARQSFEGQGVQVVRVWVWATFCVFSQLFSYWVTYRQSSVSPSHFWDISPLCAMRKRKITREALHAATMSTWNGIFWKLPWWVWKGPPPSAGEMARIKASEPHGRCWPGKTKIGFYLLFFQSADPSLGVGLTQPGHPQSAWACPPASHSKTPQCLHYYWFYSSGSLIRSQRLT